MRSARGPEAWTGTRAVKKMNQYVSRRFLPTPRREAAARQHDHSPPPRSNFRCETLRRKNRRPEFALRNACRKKGCNIAILVSTNGKSREHGLDLSRISRIPDCPSNLQAHAVVAGRRGESGRAQRRALKRTVAPPYSKMNFFIRNDFYPLFALPARCSNSHAPKHRRQVAHLQ